MGSVRECEGERERAGFYVGRQGRAGSPSPPLSRREKQIANEAAKGLAALPKLNDFGFTVFGPGPPSLWLDRLAELWRAGGGAVLRVREREGERACSEVFFCS